MPPSHITELPLEIVLQVVSHLRVWDIAPFLQAFPSYQESAILITEHGGSFPLFFKQLSGVQRKYHFRELYQWLHRIKVSGEDLFDPKKHRHPIKLVEMPYYRYPGHVDHLPDSQVAFAGEMESAAGGHVLPGGRVYICPVIPLNTSTFVFWDMSANKLNPTPSGYHARTHTVEERVENNLTGWKCHFGFSLGDPWPRTSGVKCLKLDDVVNVDGLKCPEINYLSIVFKNVKNCTLIDLDAFNLTKLVVHYQEFTPRISGVKLDSTTQNDRRFFELTKTGITTTDISDFEAMDLSFLASFTLVQFTNVPTHILQRCDLNNVKCLRLIIQQPETHDEEEVFTCPQLDTLNIQVDATDVQIPAFHAPELKTLEIGIVQDRVDLTSFERHADFTPLMVSVFRSDRLIVDSEEPMFELDLQHWRRILAGCYTLLLSGFEMPFLFDKSYMDVDDPSCLWIWSIPLPEHLAAVTLRPVVGKKHSEHAYHAKFRETGRIDAVFPHRNVSSRVRGKHDNNVACFSMMPLLLNEPREKELILSMTIADYMIPSRLSLTAGAEFDRHELNGEKLVPFWESYVENLEDPGTPYRPNRLPGRCDSYVKYYTMVTYDFYSYWFGWRGLGAFLWENNIHPDEQELLDTGRALRAPFSITDPNLDPKECRRDIFYLPHLVRSYNSTGNLMHKSSKKRAWYIKDHIREWKPGALERTWARLTKRQKAPDLNVL